MDLEEIKILLRNKDTKLAELEIIHNELNNIFDNFDENYEGDDDYDEKHKIEEVFVELVNHPNIDENLLVKISAISSFFVLDDVVKNPKTPFSVVEKIMNEEDDNYLNLQIMDHPDVTREVLEHFLHHQGDRIREKAKEDVLMKKASGNWNC